MSPIGLVVWWSWSPRDGNTMQVMVAVAGRQDSHRELTVPICCSFSPTEFPCSNCRVVFLSRSRVWISQAESCHFSLEADLKRQNDTQLSEAPLFPRAKHCQFQHMFIGRCSALGKQLFKHCFSSIPGYLHP